MPAREEYGAPAPQDPGDLQASWEPVRRRLEEAPYCWLATTRPDGRPHVVPVSGVWVDERLYMTLSPETVSARNLAAEPRAAVHLDDAEHAVIVEGRMSRPDPGEIPSAAVAAYGEKNEGHWDPADPQMPYYVLDPTLVLTWASSDIRGSAVRWRF